VEKEMSSQSNTKPKSHLSATIYHFLTISSFVLFEEALQGWKGGKERKKVKQKTKKNLFFRIEICT